MEVLLGFRCSVCGGRIIAMHAFRRKLFLRGFLRSKHATTNEGSVAIAIRVEKPGGFCSTYWTPAVDTSQPSVRLRCECNLVSDTLRSCGATLCVLCLCGFDKTEIPSSFGMLRDSVLKVSCNHCPTLLMRSFAHRGPAHQQHPNETHYCMTPQCPKQPKGWLTDAKGSRCLCPKPATRGLKFLETRQTASPGVSELPKEAVKKCRGHQRSKSLCIAFT